MTCDLDTSCLSFTAHVTANAGWQSFPGGERPDCEATNPNKGQARSDGPHRRTLCRKDQVGSRPLYVHCPYLLCRSKSEQKRRQKEKEREEKKAAKASAAPPQAEKKVSLAAQEAELTPNVGQHMPIRERLRVLILDS